MLLEFFGSMRIVITLSPCFAFSQQQQSPVSFV